MRIIHKIANYLLLFFCVPLIGVCQSPSDFDTMADRMAKGKVPDLEINEIKHQLESYLILDAREKDEYNISHIPGAIWIGFDNFNFDRIPKTSKSILVYCSVGYRSERIGEKLLQQDYTNVYNLKGSLFKWANEKLPMVDGNNEPTVNIHGFNKKWGKWVKEGNVLY